MVLRTAYNLGVNIMTVAKKWETIRFVGKIVNHGDGREAIHIPIKITQFYGLFDRLVRIDPYYGHNYFERRKICLRDEYGCVIVEKWLDIHKVRETLRIVNSQSKSDLVDYIGQYVEVEIRL